MTFEVQMIVRAGYKAKISKIKQKFTNKLGAELAANYIIQGPRGDKKEITLDREFVVYQ